MKNLKFIHYKESIERNIKAVAISEAIIEELVTEAQNPPEMEKILQSLKSEVWWDGYSCAQAEEYDADLRTPKWKRIIRIILEH